MTAFASRVNTAPAPTPGSLIGRLFYYADNSPSREAIVTPTLTLSYAQLAQLVRAQVKELNNAGISDNSTIGIRCAEDVKHLVLCLAATHIGATSCTIPSHESDETQNAIISRCGATHMIDESMAVNPASPDNNARSIAAHIPAPEAHLLFSTSGTTGEPKLVVHRDGDLVAQAHRHVGSTRERFACLATMEHNFAKRHRLYCLAAGATNVFPGAERDSLVAQVQSLDVDVLHVSAFQAQELLGAPDIDKLANIRLKLGGSHVPLTLRQQLRDNITNNLQAGYGTTETGAIAFTDPDDLDAGESVGQPLPGIEVRAVSPERKPLDTGEHGELAIRCEGMFRGYLGKPDLTAARLEDGWFYTGDIGYLDSRQRIHLCGRLDDMFVFNSMNIYPQDIESVIRQYPGVAEAAVLPRKSPVHGNIPVALIAFTGNAKKHLPELKKFVSKRVGLRSPRQYIFVDKIPTNASGKVSRREAMSLPQRSDQIRRDIIDLLDPRIKKRLKPSLISAFINGETDIPFRKIEMDSLARMELLLTLETEYDTIVTPSELGTFRYLGNVVSRVLSPSSRSEPEQDSIYPANGSGNTEIQADSPPYVVRFFRRIFGHCHAYVQLNRVLSKLENRLTPIEVDCLYDWHLCGQLVPKEAAKKLQVAVSRWLEETRGSMLKSGKQAPEPFVSRKVASNVTHFYGPGAPADKTLLICFSPSGARNMSIPNPVLMQHTDSARFDLLIISETLHKNYELGIPAIGKDLSEVIHWLTRQALIGKYGRIRTLGFSAGAHPAVVAGCLLKAEMAVSVSGRFYLIRGRFHRKLRRLFRNLGKIITMWGAVRKGNNTRVLMSYGIKDYLDCKYARAMAGISGGNRVAVEFTDDKTEHLILKQLLDRGELVPYLAHTVFADMDHELIAAKRKNVIMRFPGGQIRPA